MNKNIAQKPFGEILREARKKRRWSRARLAKETGISENSIVRYEKAGIDDDGQFPPAPKLSVLAFELGLDPTEVLFGCLTGDEYEEYSNFHLQMHPYASPLFRSFVEESVVYAHENAKLRVMLRALILDRRGTVELPNDAVEWIDEEFQTISRNVEKDDDDIFYVEDETDDEDFPFELPIENGPDQVDPSRTQSVTTNSEAAPTALSTDNTKGDDQ